MASLLANFLRIQNISFLKRQSINNLQLGKAKGVSSLILGEDSEVLDRSQQ